MSARVEVPITKEVLSWALAESGLSAAEVAEAAHVDDFEFQKWLSGEGRPSTTELRAVADKLHRQLAVFLLPRPPKAEASLVKFRHPLKGRTRPLNPEERRYIRRARRLQLAHSWLLPELTQDEPQLPKFEIAAPVSDAATVVRRKLRVSLEEQFDWKSASHAFDHWRAAVESLAVIVAQFSMGKESCRGFSLWDLRAPLIAINTAWQDEARIFTLFHELGHLLTRTSSACAEPSTPKAGTEPAERWCETFAAAVLVPAKSLAPHDTVTQLRELAALARTYRVSLRAMAIRLIDLKKASWALYQRIPPAADAKPKRSGGGKARTLREIREDEFGWRGIEIFVEAARREIISESQALNFLDIPASDFELLAADAHLR